MSENVDTASGVSERQCPFCKEHIKAEAVKCKHCGSSVAPERAAHEGTCPFCKEHINPEATICKHCKSLLTGETVAKDCGCGHDGGHGQEQRFDAPWLGGAPFGGGVVFKPAGGGSGTVGAHGIYCGCHNVMVPHTTCTYVPWIDATVCGTTYTQQWRCGCEAM